MYKLYWSKMSGAIAPQALLEEIGAEYEKIVIDMDKMEHRTPEFMAVNPWAQIPALVLPDGTLMTESAAMLLHLADRHPEAKLAPPAGSAESAHFQRWLLFMASTVYVTDMRIYHADQFTTDPTGLDGVLASARADMDRSFAILDAALNPGPYLLGETFSAADIYLWMLAAWHPEPAKMLASNPRVKQLVELVQARPAIARVWDEHKED
jgi:glutathione S-transferase/GST-like protein